MQRHPSPACKAAHDVRSWCSSTVSRSVAESSQPAYVVTQNAARHAGALCACCWGRIYVVVPPSSMMEFDESELGGAPIV
jgi:hypothetical protein